MKKFVSMFLALTMCLSLLATSAVAVEDMAESSHPEIDFEGPMIFYPFVYTEEPGWAWARELIGDCSSLVPGYLYLQDLRTKEITQIIEEPVDMFRSDHEILYCLVNGTSIVQTNYWGEEQTLLYTAQYGGLANLEYWEGVLLFTDGEHVIRIDLANNTQNDMGLYERITAIYMAEDTSFTWVNAEGVEYIRSADGQDEMVPEVIGELADAFVDTENSAEISNVNVATPYMIGVPITFPLSEYPVGSYFTKEGLPCSHHNTGTCSYTGGCACKSYRKGIQCDGFGRYVLDRYAHIPLSDSSDWYGENDPHRHDMEKDFNTADDVRAFFQTSQYAKYGTYLRLSKSHTVIIADISTTSVTLYDANYSTAEDCIVKLTEYTYAKYFSISKFRKITRIVAHSFTNAVEEYNSKYHKALCSYDGCAGYSYVEHASTNPGKNAVCQGCGYVGEIWNCAPLP